MIFNARKTHLLPTLMLFAAALLPANPLATTGVYGDIETSLGNIFRAGVWGGGAPEPGPEIVFVQGNQTCSDLGYPEEIKIDPAEPGTTATTTSEGTVTITVDNDDRFFDWTSTFGIDAVLAKGGPDENQYIYDPPAEAFEDTGLHAPLGAGSGGSLPFGISHVSFCYDLEQEVQALFAPLSVEVSDETLKVVEPEVAGTSTASTTPEQPLEVVVSDEPLEVKIGTSTPEAKVEISDEPLEVVEPKPEPKEELPTPEPEPEPQKEEAPEPESTE